MNHPYRKFVAALLGGVALLCSTASAQLAVSEAGLIGKRYAGIDFTYEHFNGSAIDQALGASAVLNLPVFPVWDLNVGYSYLDSTGDDFDGINKALSASMLTHRVTEYGTGYFAGTLGHAWNRVNVLGTSAEDNHAFWGVRAGYEVPVAKRSAINAGIGFSKAFGRNNAQMHVLRYYVEGNHWFSRDVAGVLSASYRQIKNAPDALSYTAGLRLAF